MSYKIHTIKKESDLSSCPTFLIDKYNWGGDYRPVAYGQMAYIKGKGFVINMTCEEKDPLRTFSKNEDPVFQDSAMEAFVDFAPESHKGNYVNIEMNANGAMLNRFGGKPPGRRVYTDFTDAQCICNAVIEDTSWSVRVHVPEQYVKDLFDIETFSPGDKIRCNFYKLCSNDSSLSHYGSYTVIDNPTWNFHLPEYFTDAIIV